MLMQLMVKQTVTMMWTSGSTQLFQDVSFQIGSLKTLLWLPVLKSNFLFLCHAIIPTLCPRRSDHAVGPPCFLTFKFIINEGRPFCIQIFLSLFFFFTYSFKGDNIKFYFPFIQTFCLFFFILLLKKNLIKKIIIKIKLPTTQMQI